MANTVISSGTVRVTIGSLIITSDIGTTTTLTGSNATADAKNVTTSSWTALDTGSLSDVKWLIGTNEGTASIQLATDSGGTNVIATLEPSDSCMIPWSGSVAASTFYVRSQISSSLFQYVISER